jgi:hypothetical protein
VTEENNVTNKPIIEPASLYKYYAFNEHTEKIFIHNEIYFSSPDEFADLSDSKIYWMCEGEEQQMESYLYELYLKKYPELSKEEILLRVKKLIKKREGGNDLQEILRGSRERLRKMLGIYGLSEKKDNILMWVHYAKRHSGFCLEFDVNNEFFALHSRTIKVDYKAILPILNVLQLNTYPKGELGTKLLTKAIDWKYEQEWRIVDHVKHSGTQNFPEDALIGVILGCRISLQNKENLFRWCSKRKHPPTIYEAREKEKEFGLDIVRIDYF